MLSVSIQCFQHFRLPVSSGLDQISKLKVIIKLYNGIASGYKCFLILKYSHDFGRQILDWIAEVARIAIVDVGYAGHFVFTSLCMRRKWRVDNVIKLQ